MKHVINYLICGLGLFVALVFILGGGLWSFIGFLWGGLLYISGDLFPNVWRDFWIGNAKILRTWGWL